MRLVTSRESIQPCSYTTIRCAAATVATAIGLVLSLATCASAPPVSQCPARAQQNPAPTHECLSAAASRQFVLDSGHLIGDQLMGWRARPGAVTLAIEFASDASIESVCLRESEGLVVAGRIRRAAAEIRSSAPAPLCFANRRIEFAWESPTVTEYAIRRAQAECEETADLPRRQLGFCRSTQSCQMSEIVRLKNNANDLVAQCVLQRLPIAIVASDTAEIALFLPAEGTSPGAQHALDSLEACDNRDRQVEGVACMIEKGWRRVE